MTNSRVHLLDDSYLRPYAGEIKRRAALIRKREKDLCGACGTLADFACAHEYYGLHLRGEKWIFREWAPNATEIFLVGDFSFWQVSEEFALKRLPGREVWEGEFPAEKIRHCDRYHLVVRWNGGQGERIPAYARRVVQDASTGLFEAQVWQPARPYSWRTKGFRVPRGRTPVIYEAHVGMAQEKAGIGTYREFRENILPRIARAGYNTVQLMAVMEHPYYGSFGYHVGSFFAASSRFGTPDELKALIDDAHARGLAVIMDLVHSHAVKNERDGLSRFDGTDYQYFHAGTHPQTRGYHDAWDSRCFDYGKGDVLHFLLSNCRYWLDEFHFDGFRFDGVTSMLYLHHGLGRTFGDYSMYFGDSVDTDAYVYCGLANKLIHRVRPDAITIAEDVSGMPGIAAPLKDGGAGFDYRLAMGIPDCWFKLVADVRDEDWDTGHIWYELTNRRREEKTVCYVECHDQALVGGKSLIFQMMDAAIYDSMHRGVRNPVTDRAVALHKMIRLLTLAASGGAYLTFMGNEFGHPEWVDFPREGNGNSYEHARRQWQLRDDPGLFFKALGDFDEAMLRTVEAAEALRSAPRLLMTGAAGKMLAFERGGLFFVFNFSPSEPLVDFPVLVPPGRYRGLLNSDSVVFGGQGRIAEAQDYPVFDDREGNEIVQHIRVYLPPRTALVLKRFGTPS